ncbi:phosphatidate cytidylyltransferase [uncultured Veillonella sp.]|uniref:phosphatidate cytidylyltransferase n=1 Tax=uncultured Veillonella sp. TaxID=159268 RepID=UPI0025D073D2|nr:phosphatidate cytidylyltransferase [uncultured Veillonella sp.]MDY3973779.1 phosphatidate cytidylyltransferase [Veillonella caviae]
MLKTRVITALIGFIIAIIAITVGGYFFSGLILLLTLLGWREFVSMIKKLNITLPATWGYVFTAIIMLTLMFHQYKWALISAVGSVMLLSIIYIFSQKRITLDVLTYAVFGFFYINGGFASILILRENTAYDFFSVPFTAAHMGELMLWLLLFCTWASDTFAYFAGRKWGQHRIVPKISPNKTLEGFIGGFIGCILTGVVYAWLTGIPVGLGGVVGFLTGIVAPLGDLFESKLKRHCSIKDSGVLLPGHGGVLDRFDSLLFAAPMILAYLM